MEKQLYEFFAPNLLVGANIRTYKFGDIFTLNNQVGLVLSGVIGVDSALDPSDQPITLRLASVNGLLNVEEVVLAPDIYKQYVCETPAAKVAVMSISHIRDGLLNEDPQVQAAIAQSLLKEYHRYQSEITETTLGLAHKEAYQRVWWALKRYAVVSRCYNALPLRKERLCTHTGLSVETVSRSLKRLHLNRWIHNERRSIRILKEVA